MSMQSATPAGRKTVVRTVTVTQTAPDMKRFEAYRRKTAAFEEWRQRLSPGDRLPRGQYFNGKTPGRKHIVMDEFWKCVQLRVNRQNYEPTTVAGFGRNSAATGSSIAPANIKKRLAKLYEDLGPLDQQYQGKKLFSEPRSPKAGSQLDSIKNS